MNNRKETTYNALVAKKDSTYYVLDYTFKESDSFQGSTWTLFEAINEDEYKDRLNCNNIFEELWKMAVNDDYTRLWLDDYIDSMSSDEIENFLFDKSYEWTKQYDEVLDLAEKEIWSIRRLDCVWGWRSVSNWNEFDVIYDVALLSEALKFEQ